MRVAELLMDPAKAPESELQRFKRKAIITSLMFSEKCSSLQEVESKQKHLSLPLRTK